MSGPTPTKIDLYFYRTAGGGEPVRDWLKDLDLGRKRMKEVQNG